MTWIFFTRKKNEKVPKGRLTPPRQVRFNKPDAVHTFFINNGEMEFSKIRNRKYGGFFSIRKWQLCLRKMWGRELFLKKKLGVKLPTPGTYIPVNFSRSLNLI